LEVKICILSELNFEHSFIYLTISILNTLILLDLDHTLIYGSYATSESAPPLFSYSQYLKVYERPHARQFISHLQDLGDIIVFTTAKEDYAMKICELLDIRPNQLLSRKDCKKVGDGFQKALKKNWLDTYQRILIVDDSPNVWKTPPSDIIHWIVPSEFRGDAEDKGLLACIDLL
jgi:RNA polymerase II subunit A small phosphatase-like protein